MPPSFTLSPAVRAAGAGLCLLAICAAPLAAAPAAPSAGSSGYVRAAQTGKPLVFSIPIAKTTLLALEGERIVSAIYDKSELDLRTESRAGQIFLRPLIDRPISLFVSSESGATLAVTLEPDPESETQSILLKRAQNAESAALSGRTAAAPAPMPASDYEAQLKRMARIASLNRETPDVVRSPACPRPSASLAAVMERLSPLKPSAAGCWQSANLAATALSVKNSSLGTVVIAPEPLTGGTVLAASLEKTQLEFGRSARIILVEALP